MPGGKGRGVVRDLLGTVTIRTRDVVGFLVLNVDGSEGVVYETYGRCVVVVIGTDVLVVLGVDPRVMMVTMVGFLVTGGLRPDLGVGEKTGFGPLVAGIGLRDGFSTMGLSDRLTDGLPLG